LPSFEALNIEEVNKEKQNDRGDQVIGKLQVVLEFKPVGGKFQIGQVLE
jgi:hypothetical protein